MTPSDIECPRCKAAKGDKCVATRQRFFQDINGRPDHEEISIPLDYHHAERVDAWAMTTDKGLVERFAQLKVRNGLDFEWNYTADMARADADEFKAAAVEAFGAEDGIERIMEAIRRVTMLPNPIAFSDVTDLRDRIRGLEVALAEALDGWERWSQRRTGRAKTDEERRAAGRLSPLERPRILERITELRKLVTP